MPAQRSGRRPFPELMWWFLSSLVVVVAFAVLRAGALRQRRSRNRAVLRIRPGVISDPRSANVTRKTLIFAHVGSHCAHSWIQVNLQDRIGPLRRMGAWSRCTVRKASR